MKNLLNSVFLLVILWIPQGWAATIHSVAAGGDWNKAETWVGGQVPGEDDSVVVNGEVAIDYTAVAKELTVSPSGKLLNENNDSNTLTVNGNVVNNGTISNNETSYLYLKVSGNITNNGVFNNRKITFIEGSATRKVTATSPIESLEIYLDADIEIVGNAIFTGKISFNSKQLTVNQSNVVSFGDADGIGILQGMGKLKFTGSSISYVELTGKVKEIIFEGQEQNIYGQFTADNVIFGGSGNKNITHTTVVNGSVIVNKGVTLLNENNDSNTLTVNGNVVNNGTISNNETSYLYLKVSGNITNNGVFNNRKITFIEGSATRKVTATSPIESLEIYLDADIEIVGNAIFTGKISFNSKQLTVNQSNVVSFGDADGIGILQGMGKLKFTGSSISYVELTGKVKEIIFEGQEQNIYGQFTADNVIFGGSGNKNITHTTVVNGSVIVNKGVTLLNENNDSNTLTINGNLVNNGTISNNESSNLYLKIAGNIQNNGTWNNHRTTITFPSGQFRMTNTPTWEEPKNTSSYEITDYLTTQHHWQVSADGNTWSKQRGINDPSLVATVGKVTIPEVIIPPVQDSNATISDIIKPKVYITTNSYLYSKEFPDISVYLTTDVEGAEITEELYDIYVAIGGPNGLALFDSGQGILGLTKETLPYADNVVVMKSDWIETFNYEFTESAAAGDYFVHIGVLDQKNNIISEDSIDFLYNPDYKDPFIATETSVIRSSKRSNRASKLSDDLKVFYPELKNKLKMYDVVSSAKDGLDLLEDVGSIVSDYINNGKNCNIDETQRDFLLVAGMMEYVLNKFSVYKGADIKFSGALKEIYKAENQRLIKYQSVLAGSVFLYFEHVTRFFRIDSAEQRTLKVEIKPIFYFTNDWRKKIYHHQMSRDKRIKYAYYVDDFEIQSKKNEWGDNRHELKSVTPGAYSITATDTTNDRVYRTNRVFKKLGEIVTIKFDYDGDYEEISTQSTGIECP